MDEQEIDKGSLGKGLLIAGGVNIVALGISAVTILVGFGFVLLMGFGLLQFLWLLPFYLNYRRKGEGDTCKGILLGGGLTVLLSAACWNSFKSTGFH